MATCTFNEELVQVKKEAVEPRVHGFGCLCSVACIEKASDIRVTSITHEHYGPILCECIVCTTRPHDPTKCRDCISLSLRSHDRTCLCDYCLSYRDGVVIQRVQEEDDEEDEEEIEQHGNGLEERTKAFEALLAATKVRVIPPKDKEEEENIRKRPADVQMEALEEEEEEEEEEIEKPRRVVPERPQRIPVEVRREPLPAAENRIPIHFNGAKGLRLFEIGDYIGLEFDMGSKRNRVQCPDIYDVSRTVYGANRNRSNVLGVFYCTVDATGDELRATLKFCDKDGQVLMEDEYDSLKDLRKGYLHFVARLKSRHDIPLPTSFSTCSIMRVMGFEYFYHMHLDGEEIHQDPADVQIRLSRIGKYPKKNRKPKKRQAVAQEEEEEE